jgi:hypothetical protein
MMLSEVFMVRKRPTYTPEFKAEAVWAYPGFVDA